MLELFINSGTWGYIIVFIAVITLILLITQMFVRDKTILVVSSLLTFIPYIIGYIGTIMTSQHIEIVMANTDNVDILNEVMQGAKASELFGLYISVPLILIALFNIVFRR